ncbi:YbaB/EbfC family nucleoid-associated protein [Metamycoplasma subdolum]|nr:YbaB/EbfC family nucleoid-associated protein [Metamycoplasma subdolum]WPB50773.1 YbaB/EbfC family nucleoid-associated protein [Metamycoplasma subdolum]
MNEMLKRAKKLQVEMEKDEKALQNQEFEVTKQGIKVVMLGTRRIKSITIDEALIDPDDPELVQDLVMLAINEVLEIIDDAYDDVNSKYSNSGMPI